MLAPETYLGIRTVEKITSLQSLFVFPIDGEDRGVQWRSKTSSEGGAGTDVFRITFLGLSTCNITSKMKPLNLIWIDQGGAWDRLGHLKGPQSEGPERPTHTVDYLTSS